MAPRSAAEDARRTQRQLGFMLLCPFACAVLPLLAFGLLAWRHAPAADYPACHDALAASGAPYVRPFGEARSFGRPGLSHVTLHGAVQHGAREVEVWQQAFAPGAGTPIHRHDCEEVFVVLAGGGTLYTREGGGGGPGARVRPLRFGANSTLVVPRNAVHQLVNTEAALLQLTVIISRPPMRVFVYDDWDTPDAHAAPRVPYTFDRACASGEEEAPPQLPRSDGDLH